MYCENCGKEIQNGLGFCPYCNAPTAVVSGTPATYNTGQQTSTVGEHVSTGGWFGRILLSFIPIVGIIMLFVWAFGNTQQKSLQTWARAQLIFMLIMVGVIFFMLISSSSLLSYIAYAAM